MGTPTACLPKQHSLSSSIGSMTMAADQAADENTHPVNNPQERGPGAFARLRARISAIFSRWRPRLRLNCLPCSISRARPLVRIPNNQSVANDRSNESSPAQQVPRLLERTPERIVSEGNSADAARLKELLNLDGKDAFPEQSALDTQKELLANNVAKSLLGENQEFARSINEPTIKDPKFLISRSVNGIDRWFSDGDKPQEIAGSRSLLLALDFLAKLTASGKQVDPGKLPSENTQNPQSVSYLEFATAMLLAAKVCEDEIISNDFWAEVIGVDLDTLNECEKEFSFAVKFNLIVEPEDFLGLLNDHVVQGSELHDKLKPVDVDIEDRGDVSIASFDDEKLIEEGDGPLNRDDISVGLPGAVQAGIDADAELVVDADAEPLVAVDAERTAGVPGRTRKLTGIDEGWPATFKARKGAYGG